MEVVIIAYLVYKHNSYYAVFSNHGRKSWIHLGKIDKKTARQILKRLEDEK
jgi:predicted membrane chloride channel (bestrophin family)